MPLSRTTRWFSLLSLVLSTLLLSGCGLLNRKPDVSGLQVTTDGVTAAVLLNGSKVGSTPYSDQNLKPGTYTVRLEPEDSELADYETSVTLYRGTLAVVNWTLGKTPETSGGVVYEMEPLKKNKESNLSIASIPDGAIVKVDDASQGFTPVLLKSMTPGSHRFLVSLPSYKDQEESVNIVEGFQMNITVKLAKQKVTPVEPEASVEAEVASESASATSSARNAKATPTPTPKTKTDTTKDSTPSARGSTSSSEKTLTIIETGTGWLRVRASASSSGAELAKVDVGESFPYTDNKDGWYEIEYEKGKTGWVNAKYVKLD